MGTAKGLAEWHVSSSFAALTGRTLGRALIQWQLNKVERHPTPPFAAGALSECDKRSLIFNLTSAYNVQVASLFSQRCYKQGLSQGNWKGNIKIVLKTSLVMGSRSSELNCAHLIHETITAPRHGFPLGYCVFARTNTTGQPR